jgi:hypothetical protein
MKTTKKTKTTLPNKAEFSFVNGVNGQARTSIVVRKFKRIDTKNLQFGEESWGILITTFDGETAQDSRFKAYASREGLNEGLTNDVYDLIKRGFRLITPDLEPQVISKTGTAVIEV